MPDPRRAFTTLVGMHLSELRGQFVPMLLFTLVLPLAFAAGLHALLSPQSAFAAIGVDESSQGAFIVSASTVATLLGITWVVLPQQFAQMKAAQRFGFFAGFAVGRGTYLLAVLVSYAIATLPGVLSVSEAMVIALHVPLNVSLASLAVVPLGFIALAATGGALGLARLSTAAITAISTSAYFVALGVLAALAIGATGAAHTLVLLFPPSQAADLLTATLTHLGTSTPAPDVAGLGLYAVGGAYLTYRSLPWRVGATQPQSGG
jgi:hypothetical protein